MIGAFIKGLLPNVLFDASDAQKHERHFMTAVQNETSPKQHNGFQCASTKGKAFWDYSENIAEETE